MDAIALLKSDHQTVERLFARYEETGPRARKARQQLAERITEELAVHAAIEEQVFYPAVRREVEGVEDTVLEALEEHHIVKWTLSELEGMAPSDERFNAKVTVLIESVRHHVKEEERDLFPAVRKALGRSALSELGAALERAKKLAPTRPHPRAPDEPPGNIVAGAMSGVADQLRTAGKQAASKVSKAAASRRSG